MWPWSSAPTPEPALALGSEPPHSILLVAQTPLPPKIDDDQMLLERRERHQAWSVSLARALSDTFGEHTGVVEVLAGERLASESGVAEFRCRFLLRMSAIVALRKGWLAVAASAGTAVRFAIHPRALVSLEGSRLQQQYDQAAHRLDLGPPLPSGGVMPSASMIHYLSAEAPPFVPASLGSHDGLSVDDALTWLTSDGTSSTSMSTSVSGSEVSSTPSEVRAPS